MNKKSKMMIGDTEIIGTGSFSFSTGGKRGGLLYTQEEVSDAIKKERRKNEPREQKDVESRNST